MDMLNFGIVFPLLPSIAEEFHANAMQAPGSKKLRCLGLVMFSIKLFLHTGPCRKECVFSSCFSIYTGPFCNDFVLQFVL